MTKFSMTLPCELVCRFFSSHSTIDAVVELADECDNLVSLPNTMSSRYIIIIKSSLLCYSRRGFYKNSHPVAIRTQRYETYFPWCFEPI